MCSPRDKWKTDLDSVVNVWYVVLYLQKKRKIMDHDINEQRWILFFPTFSVKSWIFQLQKWTKNIWFINREFFSPLLCKNDTKRSVKVDPGDSCFVQLKCNTNKSFWDTLRPDFDLNKIGLFRKCFCWIIVHCHQVLFWCIIKPKKQILSVVDPNYMCYSSSMNWNVLGNATDLLHRCQRSFLMKLLHKQCTNNLLIFFKNLTLF